MSLVSVAATALKSRPVSPVTCDVTQDETTPFVRQGMAIASFHWKLLW